MSLFDDLLGLFIILLFAFAIYMRSANKSVRDVIVEIREGFK